MAQYPAPTHCNHSISIQCFYPSAVPTILSQVLDQERKCLDEQVCDVWRRNNITRTEHVCPLLISMEEKCLKDVINEYWPKFAYWWWGNASKVLWVGSFWEISISIFCNAKNWPIFANFEPFFPSNSILLIFWIERMFPKCSQILVQDFRHQNFGIWIILGWVMAILVKNIGKITKLLCKGAKYLVFSQKLP